MYTRNLLTTGLLALITLSIADQSGSLEKDIASFESAHSDIASSIFAWAETETAVPTNVLQAEFDGYFDALVSETTTPIPGYLTYLPTPLVTPASELLVSEASLVASDLPRTHASGGETKTITSTNTSTVASTTSYVTSKVHMSGKGTAGTASAGVSNSMNVTKSMVTGPMLPPKFTTSPPKSMSKSEASQLGGLLVAVGVGMLGVLGVMLCL